MSKIERGATRQIIGGYIAPGVREVGTETVFYEHETQENSDECKHSCAGCAAKRRDEERSNRT
jgi:hypothetical protein